MAKIVNDKYYTQSSVAKKLVEKFNEIIGFENISEYLEPSAGNGVFLPFFKKPTLSYDLYPENDMIFKQNYLTLILPYKKGRSIVGNPPFGVKNTLAVQFFKKSISLGDYIGFVLPISQLNNNSQMYDFDLIYSEDLGIQDYSEIKLHCCFNIFKRPEKGLNSKPRYDLKDIDIVEYRRGLKEKEIIRGYDYAMGAFGAGCVGKKITKEKQFALEYYFYIKNIKIRENILSALESYEWKEYSKGISGTYRLPQWKIIKKLKELIPELQ